MSTRIFTRPDRMSRVLIVFACLLLAAGCTFTSYTLDGWTSVRTGRYTKDADRLASVNQIAVTAFYGHSDMLKDGSYLATIMDAVYREAVEEMGRAGDVTFSPLDQVAQNPVYGSVAAVNLPDKAFSPVPGLTDLPSDIQGQDLSDLFASLGVNALLFLRIEFEWEFPTINAANVRTKQHAFLMGQDGAILWEVREAAWVESVVPLPVDFSRMLLGDLTVEEWEIVAEATAGTQQVRGQGGAPIFFLLDDIAAAQGGG